MSVVGKSELARLRSGRLEVATLLAGPEVWGEFASDCPWLVSPDIWRLGQIF